MDTGCVRGGEAPVLRAMKRERERGSRRICVIFCSQADSGRNMMYFIKKLLCKGKKLV